jgi:hypothetical protein
MTYLEWNEKLHHYYFKTSSLSPFVLDASIELLIQLNEGKEDSYEDFISAIKEGFPLSPRFHFDIYSFGGNRKKTKNIIDKAIWLRDVWRKNEQYLGHGMQARVPIWNNSYPPPYLAYVYFLILSANDENYERYYEGIKEKIGESIGSSYGEKILELFKDFKCYSSTLLREFFYFNIHTGGGGKYVGPIYSQLPLSKKEKEQLIPFFSESGIEVDEAQILNDDELRSLVCNSGQGYVEKNTFEHIKNISNPTYYQLIIRAIRLGVEGKSWNIDERQVERKAKERIQQAELLFVLYEREGKFALRLGSEQDFTRLDFEGGFTVEKRSGDYVSENIKINGKPFIVEDFKKLPKLKYEGQLFSKFKEKKEYVFLNYVQKNIYIQSSEQERSETYLLALKDSLEVNEFIRKGWLIEVTDFKNDCLYKTTCYLDSSNPRITFEGGAKKNTGVYSRYWLPKVNFHNAAGYTLIIGGIKEYENCPESLDLMNDKDLFAKINFDQPLSFQLQKSGLDPIEKILYISAEYDLRNFEGLTPSLFQNTISEIGTFNKRLQVQTRGTIQSNIKNDDLLVELSIIAGTSGFIPAKMFSKVLYTYLKVVYEDELREDAIKYDRDVRDPFMKLLEGAGYLQKKNDKNGIFQGVFISSPFLLPISVQLDRTKCVLRGARIPQLIERLTELKANGKIIDFTQEKSQLFSLPINNCFPVEIMIEVWNTESEYAKSLSPSKVAKELGISYRPQKIENQLIQNLPSSFGDVKKGDWFNAMDIESAIDNPLELQDTPCTLAYQSKVYLKPQYIVFDGEQQFKADKNWAIFYVKVKRELPILLVEDVWNGAKRVYEETYLYIEENEPLPEEIFTAICMFNRQLPELCSLELEKKSRKFYKFQHLSHEDLRIIQEELNQKYSLQKSIVKFNKQY